MRCTTKKYFVGKHYTCPTASLFVKYIAPPLLYSLFEFPVLKYKYDSYCPYFIYALPLVLGEAPPHQPSISISIAKAKAVLLDRYERPAEWFEQQLLVRFSSYPRPYGHYLCCLCRVFLDFAQDTASLVCSEDVLGYFAPGVSTRRSRLSVLPYIQLLIICLKRAYRTFTLGMVGLDWAVLEGPRYIRSSTPIARCVPFPTLPPNPCGDHVRGYLHHMASPFPDQCYRWWRRITAGSLEHEQHQ